MVCCGDIGAAWLFYAQLCDGSYTHTQGMPVTAILSYISAQVWFSLPYNMPQQEEMGSGERSWPCVAQHRTHVLASFAISTVHEEETFKLSLGNGLGPVRTIHLVLTVCWLPAKEAYCITLKTETPNTSGILSHMLLCHQGNL